jgi:hypothetical protein
MNALIVQIKRMCKTELSKVSLMSASSVVTKPSCLPFRALVITLLGSIGSIIKGKANKPASPLHTSVQWVLTVQIPTLGCLLAHPPFPRCNFSFAMSEPKQSRKCSNASVQTEHGFPSISYLTSAGRCPYTHAGPRKDKTPIGFCLPVSFVCLRRTDLQSRTDR